MAILERRRLTQTSGTVASLARRDAMRAVAPADSMSAKILGMQQNLGNQAVQQRASLCPAFPSACPTGGACHTCPARIQAKLAVNQPGDVYEQEADRVAEAVMRMPSPQTPAAGADSGGVQPSIVPPVVHEVLRSPGQPLDVAARAFFEPRLNRDFNQVRVHRDAKAAESARAVNALAYTVGRDVVFGAGQYTPGTEAGKRLLAHELMHVLQQRGSAETGRAPTAISDPSDPSEREADRVAASITASNVPAFQPGRWENPNDQVEVGHPLSGRASFAEHRSAVVPAVAPMSILQRQTHPDPDCGDLLTRIIARLVELKERADTLIRNPLNLPPTGPMSVEGHQQQFRNKQTNLRSMLNQWDTNNCGPGYIPREAWQWATRGVPSPAPSSMSRTVEAPREGSEITAEKVAKGIGVGVGVGVGLYVAYRVVRMLPSLLPPLWWTIPANVAIP